MSLSYINPTIPSRIRGLYDADLSEKSIQTMLDLAADLAQELIDLRAAEGVSDIDELVADARRHAQEMRAGYPREADIWDDARLIDRLADALADQGKPSDTLTIERENAAREYTRRNVDGMQPVMTVGDRVHDAFVSGAEWEADQGEPQITAAMVERGALALYNMRTLGGSGYDPNHWEPRARAVLKAALGEKNK